MLLLQDCRTHLSRSDKICQKEDDHLPNELVLPCRLNVDCSLDDRSLLVLTDACQSLDHTVGQVDRGSSRRSRGPKPQK